MYKTGERLEESDARLWYVEFSKGRDNKLQRKYYVHTCVCVPCLFGIGIIVIMREGSITFERDLSIGRCKKRGMDRGNDWKEYRVHTFAVLREDANSNKNILRSGVK